MDQLLTRYRAAPEADRRQLLGQVAVLGAYLKRGANLMFLAQKHRYVPSAELRYALEESISSLELAGVECAMEVTQGSGFRQRRQRPVTAGSSRWWRGAGAAGCPVRAGHLEGPPAEPLSFGGDRGRPESRLPCRCAGGPRQPPR